MDNNKLTVAQQAALDYVTKQAEEQRDEATSKLRELFYLTNIEEAYYKACFLHLQSKASIALHFHPDRLDMTGQTVAESMLASGEYKSQFETKLSSGSVSAFPGGDRDNWEHRLFGEAYRQEQHFGLERPKYGALDLMLHADGPAPRFGSCYLVLQPQIAKRSTFTYMDSYQNRKEKGTYRCFESVMAALLTDAFENDYAIGSYEVTPGWILDHVMSHLDQPFAERFKQAPSRNLNHYIEAQVHGKINLETDAAMLVVDPSFKGTSIGDIVLQICDRYQLECYWHQGFSLQVDEVPGNFRGPVMPELAKLIAIEGRVDAYAIGLAAQSARLTPEKWQEFGEQAEVIQYLKMLWHVLVKYGKPY